MTASPLPDNVLDLLDPAVEAARRAARVRAMLERWSQEDVSEEPEWEPAAAPRLALRSTEREP